MAGSILSLCLSNHDGLCEAAVEILFSIIYAEYVLNGRFDAIHTEMFIRLDDLVSTSSPTAPRSLLQFSTKTPASLISDPASKAYFVTQLRGVLEKSPPVDTLQHTVGTFMDEMELFIDLLLALRDVPDHARWRDERALALYRLMVFVRGIGRIDLYMRYAHQLCSIALAAKDHLAAGYALKLQAEVYPWRMDGGLVEEHEGLGLPIQTQCQRKEALLYHAMDHFGGSRRMISASTNHSRGRRVRGGAGRLSRDHSAVRASL
jgi:dedicator of cytokinesis protein 3